MSAFEVGTIVEDCIAMRSVNISSDKGTTIGFPIDELEDIFIELCLKLKQYGHNRGDLTPSQRTRLVDNSMPKSTKSDKKTAWRYRSNLTLQKSEIVVFESAYSPGQAEVVSEHQMEHYREAVRRLVDEQIERDKEAAERRKAYKEQQNQKSQDQSNSEDQEESQLQVSTDTYSVTELEYDTETEVDTENANLITENDRLFVMEKHDPKDDWNPFGPAKIED